MGVVDLTVPEQLKPFLRVGTCSWKYDSWKGLIYQPDLTYGPDDYLPAYAQHLSTVEVDQWFWSLFPSGVKLPDQATVRTYADSVPDDFIFSIKAPNAITLTHFYAKQPKRYQSYANRPNEHFLDVDLLRRFLDRLAPMEDKTGPVMFQFEYLNKKKMSSRGAFLDQLHEFFSDAPEGFQYAIETRNPNYLSREFFEFLRDHSLGHVFLEGYYMPHIAEVFSRHDTFTADFSVIRLHGGGREEMEKRTGEVWNQIVEQKREGLEAAARIVRENVRRGIRTIVNVNNHYEGSAPLTIQRFLDLMKEP